MASAGTITVDFAAETAKFQAQLKEVNSRLKGVESSFSSLAGVAKGALAGISVGLLVDFVKSMADAGEELGRTAATLEISTDRLKAFQIAAEEAGVSQEATNQILQDSQKLLGQAATGTGKAAKTLETLGLNVRELQQLAPDELILRYSQAINSLASPSDRVAASQALLGKSAKEAGEFIATAASSLADARQFVDEYAHAVTQIQSKQIDAAGDAFGRLRIASQSATQQLVAGFAPFIEAFSNTLLQASGGLDGLSAKASQFGAILQTGFALIGNVLFSAKAAVLGFVGTWQGAMASAEEAFAGFLRTLAKLPSLIKGPLNSAADFADSLAKSVRAASDANLKEAEGSLRRVQSISQIQEGIVKTLEDSRARAEAAAAAQNAALGGTGSLLDSDLSDKMQKSFEKINDAAFQAQQALSDATNDLVAQQADAAMAAYQGQIDQQLALDQFHADERVRINLATETAIAQQRAATTNAALGFLQVLGAKNKAAAIAAIALEKALAIGRILTHSVETAQLAASTQLVPGDPTSLARAGAAGAAWLAKGAALQALLVGATGAVQIAGVLSGNSGPTGSPANPLFTRTGAADQQFGATPQSAVQVVITGNFGFDDHVADRMIETIREAVDGRDVVIINRNSRQAQELGITT